MPLLAEATEAQWQRALALQQDEAAALRLLRARRAQAPDSCWSFADPIRLGDTLYSAAAFPKAYQEFITDFQETDLGCVREFAQNYAVALGYAAFEREDFRAYCAAHEASEVCAEAKGIEAKLRANLRTLTRLAAGEQARVLSEEDCAACEHGPVTPLRSLIDEFKSKKELLACVELRPGETAIVAAGATSPTGVPANYALTKLPDNGFRVELALELSNSAEPRAAADMFERVQRCAAEFSPFLKGPAGERLELRIHDATVAARFPAKKRPPTTKISIAPFGARSTAASYAADIDCPTVAHEVLHLLGLCDEYDGRKDGFGCRPRPQTTSIMNDINRGYDAALPRVLRCECRAGSTCAHVHRRNLPELRDFFISPTVYELTDYRFRNRACTSQQLPSQAWTQLAEKRFATLPVSAPPGELRIEVRKLGQDPSRVDRELVTCKCPAAAADCAQELARAREVLALTNQVASKHCPGSSNVIAESRGTSQGLRPGAQWVEGEVRVLVPPTQQSLLLPAHFERITGGACAQRAQKYNRCAQWAYRSPEKTNSCQGKPTYCDDPTEFLGVQR